MHQRPFLTCLLIGSLLTLAACAQPASVGIPTPDRTAVPALAVGLTPAAAIPTNTTPPPAPQPTDTSAPPPPAPTATIQPPAPTQQAAQPQPAPTQIPPTAVPGNTTTKGGTGCNQLVVHIVRPGENLFRIALRYHTTIYAIARQNGITNARSIRSGRRLRITTCVMGTASDPSSGND